MKKLLLVVITITQASYATIARMERNCPSCVLESCRWEIGVSKTDSPLQIVVNWDKSVVTRHMEKPKASPLHCNVDRDFNSTAGGYVRVWFKGESEPCDASTSQASECGVEYIFDPLAAKPIFPVGFRVSEPAGKTITKVEHLSTLNLQCGVFAPTGSILNLPWNLRIGWDSQLPGDGTYSKQVN